MINRSVDVYAAESVKRTAALVLKTGDAGHRVSLNPPLDLIFGFLDSLGKRILNFVKLKEWWICAWNKAA